MKTALLSLLFLPTMVAAQTEAGLKVFISVDMEGVTGVVNSDDASRSGKDYDYFRQTMTREANAAIEGALAAGATEIIVRDSHGSALNLLPEMLHRSSKLIRDWSGGPISMMEGIDDTYDAAVFVGYHAKAGTPDGVLDHTSSGDVADVSVNGISLPETGYNALIAGHYDVPIAFVAGGYPCHVPSSRVFRLARSSLALLMRISRSLRRMSKCLSRDFPRRRAEIATITAE